MVLPGAYNLPFLPIAFLRGKEWEFGENERDINERKFDEFYVKQEKVENDPLFAVTCKTIGGTPKTISS